MNTTTFSPVPAPFHAESDTLTELVRFLEEQIRHRCARLVLAQKGPQAAEPIGDWFVEDMLDARSLATSIHGKALRDAHALRESVAYGLFAFHAASDAVVGRFVFRIEAGPSGTGSSAPAASDRAVIAMLMNHADSSARLSLGYSNEIMGRYQDLFTHQAAHMTRQLEQAYERIRILEEREGRAIEAHEKLQGEFLERSAAIESAKRKDEHRHALQKQGVDALGMLLPAVTAKLHAALGGSTSPASAAAPNVTEEQLDSLVASLEVSQIQAMVALLRVDQQVALIHLYEASLARGAAKKKAASETTAASAASPPESAREPAPGAPPPAATPSEEGATATAAPPAEAEPGANPAR
jgi:hypothetical protein